MAYQVLARKWRPQTFADVVGQEHITRTLQNAILSGRVGHAYLFVGSRGIGKTTSARIFAKALNCEAGVVAEPCCKCQSCLEIAAGNSLDVNEIDGASHNKVEDIRDLRDNVQYTPSRSRYKIYIIDEVHMLTPAAWNALLKTLEEPPAHVKFLFATTEPHKVLPTIVSRCQRFDLRRIAAPLIVNRLREIADGEGIHVDDGALNAIARAADGGMRDAQSILDQMIAFCGGLGENEMIREKDVIDVFGLASGAELRGMAVAILENNLDKAVEVIQSLATRGRDLERLFGDLIQFMRNVMIATVTREPAKLLEVSSTDLQDLCNIGKAVEPKLIQRVLQELVAQEWSFRSALNKRVYLEAALARVILEAHSIQLDDILSQLNALRQAGSIEKLPPPAPRPNLVIPPPPEPATEPEPPLSTPAVQGESSEKKKVAAPTDTPAVPTAPEAKKEAEPELPPATEPEPEIVAEPEAVTETLREETAETEAPPMPPFNAPKPEVEQDPVVEPEVLREEPAETEAPPMPPFNAPEPEVEQDPVVEPEVLREEPAETEASPMPAFNAPEPEVEQDPVVEPEVTREELAETEAPPMPPFNAAEPIAGMPPFEMEEGDNAPEFDSSFDLLNDGDAAGFDEQYDPFGAGSNPEGRSKLSGSDARGMLLRELAKSEQGVRILDLLAPLQLVSFDGQILQLGYGEDVTEENLATLRSKEAQQLLRDTFQVVTGSDESRVAIRRQIINEGSEDQKRRGLRHANYDEIMTLQENPVLKQTLDIFGGEIVDAWVHEKE